MSEVLYSDEDMIRAVHAAAGGRGHVSYRDYVLWYESGGHGRVPSISIIVRRFGSWNAALTAAGLPLSKRISNQGPRISDEVISYYLQRYADIRAAIGERPTLRGYTVWAEDHDDAPSASLVIYRTRRRWSELMADLTAAK